MAEEKTMDDYPLLAERVIRHGLFWHYTPEVHVTNGEEKLQLVQHTGFEGEKISLYVHSDIERGEKYGAFHPEGTPAFASGQQPAPPTVDEMEEEEVELADLDHEDIVNWLLSTGPFDGEPKPNIKDVVGAVGDDPELADRVLKAETEAAGGDPRDGVVKGLTKVINDSTE